MIKENIIKQWNNYFKWIHYKIFIKNKVSKLQKESDILMKKTVNLHNEITEKKDIVKNKGNELITILKNENDESNLNVYLIGKERKHNSIKKVMNRIFKFDGYLLYGNKSKDFKIIKIKNLSMIYKLKNKEAYNIIDKIGSHKGKPLFMVLYPFAITLNVNDEGELYYDAKSYYTYVDYATNSNLLSVGQEVGIKDLIKKNMPIIIFAIIILAVMFTPEGQNMLKELLGGS